MKIICLMGPTASGKTKLALELVQRLPCDIISVDSGMIYRGMDIGTAKPTKAELAIAPHRLIDIRDPAESYSVGDFRADAIREIEDILAHGRIPLLVGGTMMYFNVLQKGISALPKANLDIRKQLVAIEEHEGSGSLYKRLQQIDPITASRISPNDTQRIQRALEVYALTNKSISELHQLNPPKPLPYEVVNIILAPSDRQILRERIAARFAQMLRDGLLEEVEKLFRRGDLHANLPSIRSVGYRQMWEYREGKVSLEEAKLNAITATCQLAKRQLTWLRRWPNAQWFESFTSTRQVLGFLDKKAPI